MISILINAYACAPGMGSEPGMAWNWCINLANHCSLHIITEGEFRDKIEAVLPSLLQAENMQFYYNPVSEKVRKMCWNQGDWRFYRHYKKWQQKTFLMAEEIINKHHIDVIHQLNMIGFREPGYLWKIKDIPFVWGPVDAKEKFPTAYIGELPLKQRLFIQLKNHITGLQLKHSRRVRNAVKDANYVISASMESVKSFKKYFGINSLLINETGCTNDIFYESATDKFEQLVKKETFDILWVGKLDARKQLSLAIKSLAMFRTNNIKFHIVGGGDPDSYKSLASSLKIDDKCMWYGAVTHKEVQDLMRKSDILFFTSVAEGTPHVVLESISNCLPVICFDCCGQGDVVDNTMGIKIPLSDPEQSIVEFSRQIEYLYHNRNKLSEFSVNCIKKSKDNSWENKAKQMVELYHQAIEDFHQS